MSTLDTQFCFFLPLDSQDQINTAQQVYDTAIEFDENHDPVMFEGFQIAPHIDTTGHLGILIFARQNGLPQQVIPFLRALHIELDPKPTGKIGFAWADLGTFNADSGFGGGAVVYEFDTDDVDWLNLDDWMEDRT